MRIDWYTKIVLTVIAIALGLTTLRPFLVPPPSYAAKKMEYKVVDLNTQQLQQLEQQLNKLGNDGWDFAAVFNAGADRVSILKR